MTIRQIPLVLFAVALAACGGEEEPASASDQQVAERSTTVKAAEPARQAKAPEQQGHCAPIEPAEIEAVFPMELELGKPRVVGQPDNPLHACEVELGIGEVGQLTFGTTGEGTYNEYAKYLDRSSTPTRMIEGLGEEAFLLNNAQLLVRREDGRFLNVSVMLITLGGLPLSQEEMADAVVQLGTMMNQRL